MQKIIFNPEHLTDVIGAGALTKIATFLYHPASPSGMAPALMGLYLAAIYGMPLLCAFFADYWLGRTRAVIVGVVAMTIGIATLGMPDFFVPAILLSLIGIGFAGSLKPQVGDLYAPTDRRRSDAYQIYSLGIQVAVIFSPIISAWLATRSWKLAFGFCGVLMALSGVTYLAGLKFVPKTAPASQDKSSKTAFTKIEKKRIALIVALTILFAFGAMPNQEIFDGYLLWANQAYSLTIFGYEFPVSDLYSLDGLISSVTAVLVLWFWQFYDKRRKPVGDLGKTLIGTLICSFGPLVLAYASLTSVHPHDVSLWWGILFHTINDFGFAMTTMIGLSLVSRLSPARIATIMISFFWLHLCLSNMLVGKMASLLETMSPVYFWVMHSGFAVISVVGLLLIKLFFSDLLPKEETLVTQDQVETTIRKEEGFVA